MRVAPSNVTYKVNLYTTSLGWKYVGLLSSYEPQASIHDVRYLGFTCLGKRTR